MFITYWPVAKTVEGETLNTYDSVLSLEEAALQFKIWEEDYRYRISRALVQITDGVTHMGDIVFDRTWKPGKFEPAERSAEDGRERQTDSKVDPGRGPLERPGAGSGGKSLL